VISDWTSLDTSIVITGALIAMACALPGCFLVLRRLSLMGDALSHAVLPGIAVAFIVSGSRDPIPLFIGASVIGVVTALLIQFLHRVGRLDESASMGVIFTALFAAGLVLIRIAADRVDLDPDCVLYGSLELTPLDQVSVLGFTMPRAAAVAAFILLVNGIFITFFFKELRLVAFDPAMADALGIPSRLFHYLLMTCVAATCVAAFESVGSILVIVMLIVPAATAHLLCDRLGVLLIVAMVAAALSAVLGHAAAIVVPEFFGLPSTTSAGMMATMSGLLFFAALMAAPRHGLIARFATRSLLSFRILREDVLGALYRAEEFPATDLPRGLDAPQLQHTLLLSHRRLTPALLAMRMRGWIQRTGARYLLTEAGRVRARTLIRSHRLWEDYLVHRAGLPSANVHAPAEQFEHVTDPAMLERLAQVTGDPAVDPHAREIPAEIKSAK
jgi:manganese/zinc/iron transport system permease protein